LYYRTNWKGDWQGGSGGGQVYMQGERGAGRQPKRKARYGEKGREAVAGHLGLYIVQNIYT